MPLGKCASGESSTGVGETCSSETARDRQTDVILLGGRLQQRTGEQHGERVKLAMTGGHVTVIIELELLPHLQVASQVTPLSSSILNAVS